MAISVCTAVVGPQLMAPRKVLFAFRRNQINMGGKIMRVDQLSVSELARMELILCRAQLAE